MFGLGGLQHLFKRTLSLKVEIISKNVRTGFIGLDYTLWIDVSVHNYGGP